MNLLDMIAPFEAFVSFEGDDENDCNEITIRREQYDNNGQEIIVREDYAMSRDAMEDLLKGLDVISEKIREYLIKEEF